MTERARGLAMLVEHLRRIGAVEPVVVGLAGSEPLWPIFAESARLLSPLSRVMPRLALFDLLSDHRAYAELLMLLRDGDAGAACSTSDAGDAQRGND